MFANGSLLCASKPAEIRITSGLNLSILSKIFPSNMFKNSSLLVPDRIGTLKILPTPVSFSKHVPGNKGCSCIEP